MEWAARLPRKLHHATYRVLSILAMHADDDGRNAYPSLATISALAQTNNTTVLRSIGQLLEMGIVSRAASPGRSNGYLLNMAVDFDISVMPGSGSVPAAAVVPRNRSKPVTVVPCDSPAPVPDAPEVPADSRTMRPKQAENGSMVRIVSRTMQPDSVVRKEVSVPPTAAPGRDLVDQAEGTGHVIRFPDARTALFNEGLFLLKAMTGRPTNACRTILGRLLRDLKNDAATVHQIILEAADLRPAVPMEWIMAASLARSRTHSSAAEVTREWNLPSMVDEEVLAVAGEFVR